MFSSKMMPCKRHLMFTWPLGPTLAHTSETFCISIEILVLYPQMKLQYVTSSEDIVSGIKNID